MKPVSELRIAQAPPIQKIQKTGEVVSQSKSVKVTPKKNYQAEEADIGITVRMRTRLMSLQQAEENITTAATMLQVTDKHLVTIERILQQLRVVSLKSSNGIYTNENRNIFQVEVSQLVDEIDRISSHAEYNHLKLLTGDFSRDSRAGSMWVHMGPNMNDRERIYISTMTARAFSLKNMDGSIISISTAGFANETIGRIDMALLIVEKERGDIKGYLDRLREASKDIIDELSVLEKTGSARPDSGSGDQKENEN